MRTDDASSCGTCELRGEVVVQSFRTRQATDAPEMVRTIGTLIRAGREWRRTRDELVGRIAAPRSARSAFGKVVLLEDDPPCRHAVCHQCSADGEPAPVIACGNAMAAAAALSAQLCGMDSVTLKSELCDRAVIDVHACVSPGVDGAELTVRQTWDSVRMSFGGETVVAGRQCLVGVGSLNNYLLVRTAHDRELDAWGVDQARALWQHFGLLGQALLARMAVLQIEPGAMPRVKFFTCGRREHPSAPLTGLAVLAAAAHRGWIELRGQRAVRTPSGLMPLPRVRSASDGGIAIDFPALAVQLGPVEALGVAA